MSPNRLAVWLKRQSKNIEGYSLYYITGDSSETKVSSWIRSDEVPEDKSERESALQSFAQKVVATATDYATAQSVTCRFYFRCLDGADKVISSTVIKQDPEIDEEESSDLMSPQLNSGNTALQQMVRINEVLIHVVVGSMGKIIQGYNALLKTQTDEILSLRKREERLQVLVEKAALEVLDSEEGSADKSIAIQKLTDLAEKVVPQIIDKMGGNGSTGGFTFNV